MLPLAVAVNRSVPAHANNGSSALCNVKLASRPIEKLALPQSTRPSKTAIALALDVTRSAAVSETVAQPLSSAHSAPAIHVAPRRRDIQVFRQELVANLK